MDILPPQDQQTIDLAITGMTCAACVGRVEKVLGRVPGVTGAAVNLATGRARVTGIHPDLAALLRAAKKAGYEASEVQEKAAPPPSDLPWLLASAVLSAPLLAGMIHPALMAPPLAQFLLATPVQFVIGWRFYRGAWYALRGGTGNMDLLVALGSTAAWALSVWLWWVMPHAHMLYFESSAVLITFILFGKYLETRARRGTASALRGLMKLRPDTARVLREGVETEVPLAAVTPGDTVTVRPGERIPVDGVVREGQASLDLALLTGESRPVETGPGAKAPAGAINLDGHLTIETTATGAETMLGRIIRLVESAQASKAPAQKLADRISAVFVPVVLVIAVLTFAAWLLLHGDVTEAALNAVAVLVIACPCALGLATPAAIVVATGVAARHGILIRDATVLDTARDVRTVLFDKTGTLTEGRPRLAAIAAVDGDDAALLRLAAALQAKGEHPLAKAVRARAEAEGIVPPPASDFRVHPGLGVAATVEGRALILGNARMLAAANLRPAATHDEGDTVSWLAETAPGPRMSGGTSTAHMAGGTSTVSMSGGTPTVSIWGDTPTARILGVLRWSDTLKPNAAPAIAALRAMGLRTVMLTGDNQAAADRVGRALGLDETRANLLPEDKARAVASFGGHAAMIGDGINDAPALAAASVGMAMATGTDVAMETAGITLMRGDPMLVPAALDIARRANATIRQGLAWAFLYNVLGIPLAALGMLSPVIAGGAMALSSVSVVANALLLRRWRPAVLAFVPASASAPGLASAPGPTSAQDRVFTRP